LDYSIHKIFRDVNNVKFRLERDWSKEHEVYHLQWIGLFELALGRSGRSNQVKSKKDWIGL